MVAAFALALVAKGTVVLVHGAGGGGWEFDFWKPIWLRAGWRVVNRSLQPAKGGLAKTTLEDYEGQVVAWCKNADRPLVLVGASMGGGLSLRVNDRVKPDAIVLVGSVPPKGLGDEAKDVAFPPVVKWANGPFEETRAAMPDSDLRTQRWAWKRWRDESGSVMSSLAKGVSARAPQCPVLVVWGAQDTDVPLATGRRIAEAYGADLKVYAATSHVGPLMGKRAKEIAKDVVSWVSSRLLGRE